ncbi:L,D-transpeptidase [Lacibacter sp.]|uniref:L,D-transpeptidase n=1 Tax=Lacibacter sp. TaxID=1915409 RepID=UPI002B4B82D9|nr:L,D-transpeptidase [Lacibacter sp.]HLP39712.1 L,D-transpeptidase [Lacibacter sp.]
MRYTHIVFFLLAAFVFAQCEQPTDKKIPPKKKRAWVKPVSLSYHVEKPSEWLRKNASAAQKKIVMAVNRTDSTFLKKMDSILVPDDLSADLELYLPFPTSVSSLSSIEKIILFSYPSQTFGAYEYGELLYAGPTNMGRKADPTPTGLYYTNWKAEKTTSTFNDEWDLLWNFNIENKLGVGFHQYELPGYPASHSCLRLLESDAKLLYEWADQWVLNKKEELLAKGTPVIVFGSYPFDGTKPWWQLLNDPHALDISEETIQQVTAPFLNDILKQQQQRNKFNTDKD